jgi:hypothetical protein
VPPLPDRQELAHDPGQEGRGLITTSVRRGAPPALPSALSLLPAPTAAGPAPLDDALPPAGEAAFRSGPGYAGRNAHPGSDDGPDGPGDPRGWSPPRRPQRNRGERKIPLFLLTAAFVITAGLGLLLGGWLGFPGGAGAGQRPGAGSPAAAVGRAPSASAALTPPRLPATAQKTLKQALALVNVTVWTTGYLPQKSCRFLSAVSAQCSNPYPGVTMAFFQNYSSPGALYKAYEAAIKQANNGRFVVNVQDCGASAPPASGAEISWNHFGEHTRAYSLQQLETGKLNAASQAAGRMFCNYDSRTNTEDIIWTETDGNLLGEVTGSPHLAVWSWWLHVHHNIAFNGQPMGAMDMAPSAFPKA